MFQKGKENGKATKEYLNQRGTKIRVFRACCRTPFLPPFCPHFSPLFPLQALCILAPPLPSSPPPKILKGKEKKIREGSRELQKRSKLAPPSVPPPEALFDHPKWERALGLRPEPPFTGVSGPSGPEIAKKSQKGSFLGVWREVSENTRKV